MPSILFAGATGNTGVGAVETFCERDKSARVLVLTRNAKGEVAQKLAKIDQVEVIEKDWKMVDTAWLQEHEVEKIFIASAVTPTQFTDESLFLTCALEAGVKYVVRISTTTSNIAPNTKVFYPRAHWAIETMLSTPEFDAMDYTSLQPNVYPMYIAMAGGAWLTEYKQTGKKMKLAQTFDENAGVAAIDPYEIGIIAGRLLALDDHKPHANKKYTLIGPSNVSGRDVVDLVEKVAGTTVDETAFRDTSVTQVGWLPENLHASLAKASIKGWEGECSVEQSPTSPEIMELYAPKVHAKSEVEKYLRQAWDSAK